MTGDKVIKKLATLGYDTLDEMDYIIIDYAVRNTEMCIKNFCNIGKIPDELEHVVINTVCGDFLYQKYCLGLLPGSFDFELACESLKEGDVQINFNTDSNSTNEQRFVALVNELKTIDYNCLLRYRKLVW